MVSLEQLLIQSESLLWYVRDEFILDVTLPHSEKHIHMLVSVNLFFEFLSCFLVMRLYREFCGVY